MSDDQKKVQIADAVMEYQAAKSDLGHVEKRLQKVGEAYRNAGNAFQVYASVQGHPRVHSGKVLFDGANVATSDMLNEAELAQLLEERASAFRRMQTAIEEMSRLGITVR